MVCWVIKYFKIYRLNLKSLVLLEKKNTKFKNFIFIENINVKNFKKVENLINNINPAYVINCSGLIKQKLEKKTIQT